MKTITLELVGLDGNAYNLLAAFAKQARAEGWSTDEISVLLAEAANGDYDHLLVTLTNVCKSPDYNTDDYTECSECWGSGEIDNDDDYYETCQECMGTGYVLA